MQLLRTSLWPLSVYRVTSRASHAGPAARGSIDRPATAELRCCVVCVSKRDASTACRITTGRRRTVMPYMAARCAELASSASVRSEHRLGRTTRAARHKPTRRGECWLLSLRGRAEPRARRKSASRHVRPRRAPRRRSRTAKRRRAGRRALSPATAVARSSISLRRARADAPRQSVCAAKQLRAHTARSLVGRSEVRAAAQRSWRTVRSARLDQKSAAT